MVHAFIRPAAQRPRHHLKRGEAKPRSYWEVRPKGILFLPPCTFGFSSLVTPDSFGDNGPKFKGNAHFTQVQAEAAADLISSKIANEANFEALKKALMKDDKEAIAKKLKLKAPADWLESALKEPKEKSRIQLPYLTIACNAFYKNKQQESVKANIQAWDAKGNVLDLPSLHLGMGSIVQFGVSAALWHGTLATDYKDEKRKKDPIAWWAVPSLRLIGVRVLKLEQFGAGNSDVGAVSEEELVGVEEGFEAEDLAGFARREDRATMDASADDLNTGITSDGPEEF